MRNTVVESGAIVAGVWRGPLIRLESKSESNCYQGP